MVAFRQHRSWVPDEPRMREAGPQLSTHTPSCYPALVSDPTPLYIKFFAPVAADSIALLMQAVDQALKDRTAKIVLLISTPGGNVFHGLSAYNFLRGLPVDVETHNFGTVDSIGVTLFCAGKRRLSVPHARFLLHAVSAGFPANAQLEEKQLEERLNALRSDIDNIARVIGDTTGKPKATIIDAMHNRTTLTPEQARDWQLVTEIRSELIPAGANLFSIQQAAQPPQP